MKDKIESGDRGDNENLTFYAKSPRGPLSVDEAAEIRQKDVKDLLKLIGTPKNTPRRTSISETIDLPNIGQSLGVHRPDHEFRGGSQSQTGFLGGFDAEK